MCCWKRVFVMTSVFSLQNSISLCPASFCTPRLNLLLLQLFLDKLRCVSVKSLHSVHGVAESDTTDRLNNSSSKSGSQTVCELSSSLLTFWFSLTALSLPSVGSHSSEWRDHTVPCNTNSLTGFTDRLDQFCADTKLSLLMF